MNTLFNKITLLFFVGIATLLCVNIAFGTSDITDLKVEKIQTSKKKKIFLSKELDSIEKGSNIIRYSTKRFSLRYIMKGKRMVLQQYFYDNHYDKDTVNYSKIKEITWVKSKDSLQTNWYLAKGKKWELIGQYPFKKGVDY